MELNQLTQKSQEAVLGARSAADTANHQYVDPVHLLSALLGQGDGLVYPLLAKLEISPRWRSFLTRPAVSS